MSRNYPKNMRSVFEGRLYKIAHVAENAPALALKSSLLLSWQFKAWP